MIVIAVASALGVLLLRQVKPELAVIIGLVGTILIFLMVVSGLTQVIGSINGIVAQTGLATQLFASILKIVGIGYLCEIAASICQEAGAKAVSDMVILGGKVLIMVLAIPIIQALVDVVLGVLP
jgi:stage III sporulation protein AD